MTQDNGTSLKETMLSPQNSVSKNQDEINIFSDDGRLRKLTAGRPTP